MSFSFSNLSPKLAKKSVYLRKYRYFNLVFLSTTTLALLSVGIFNIIINPYGVFNVPKLTGINQGQEEKQKSIRLFKAIDITRIKPKTIFLGASRTEYGLNPNHPALSRYQPVYNLGIAAATPYEMLRYLQHSLANQPNLKIVIVNLDEFMFNELNKEAPGFSENRLEKTYLTPQDFLQTTLSFDALSASLNNLESSKNNPEYQSYTPQGMLNLRPIDKNPLATNYRFQRNIGFYFYSFPEYKFASKYLEDLKKLVALCKQHNITLKVFISPSHATRWETLWVSGHWQKFEQMKREIIKIVPVWDFSGYNSITTEPINDNMKNYIDDSHYKKEVGDLILNRLFDYNLKTLPSDFGVLLTPQNIESHLDKIRQNREIWAEKNPDEVNFVRDIKSKNKR